MPISTSLEIFILIKTMLSISLTFLFSLFPSMVLGQPSNISNFRKLNLPTASVGPESITFDFNGKGPYTGISDGRIVKYDESFYGFVDFAITSPNRSKALCDGTSSPTLAPICGRPLGMEFYKQTNQLFIADAYQGLNVVGPNGNLATQIASSAEGMPFIFLNGLSIDQVTGDIYFTEFSTRYVHSQAQEAVAANDATGRLLKYDYRTKQVTVLLRGLSGANGVAISADRSYLLVAEFIGNRTQRFWLRGPKALSSEVVINFQGSPDNIKRRPNGDFLVALSATKPGTQNTKLPVLVIINGDGDILQNLSLDQYYGTIPITEVEQHGAHYFVGTMDTDYVGVYN